MRSFRPRNGSTKTYFAAPPVRRASPPTYASPLMVAVPIVSVCAMQGSGRAGCPEFYCAWNSLAKDGPVRLMRRRRAVPGAQGFLFVLMDFEHLDEPRQFQHFPRRAAQAVECEPAL